MKKIILFIILGCLSIYGLSINPIDPPAKPAIVVKATVPESPVTTEECSDLLSLVNVTVVVTFTDCPDYDCKYPDSTCTIQLCIYDGPCLSSPLRCEPFNTNKCSYSIDVRVDQASTLYSRLVVTGCTNGWNTDCLSCSLIPQGGGTVYCSRTFCP